MIAFLRWFFRNHCEKTWLFMTLASKMVSHLWMCKITIVDWPFSSRGKVWWKCIRQGCFYWFWILVYIASCIPKVYRRLSLRRVAQMHLILNLCISEGFDTFLTLLYTWADECCMVSLLKSMITTPSYFTLPREYN